MSEGGVFSISSVGGMDLFWNDPFHVFYKKFLKTLKFPNKKGTLDVKLVFTATLACTKRALLVL
jgi:hypothetical protein